MIGAWLESTALAQWVAVSDIGYPLMLTCHAVGLAVAVGVSSVVALRVLGLAPGIAFAPLTAVCRVAWVGFVLNVASGTALFAAEANVFVVNPAFLVKLTAVVVAVLCVALLHRQLARAGASWDAGAGPSPAARLSAVGCVLWWAVAVVAGRMIAYVEVVA